MVSLELQKVNVNGLLRTEGGINQALHKCESQKLSWVPLN